MRKLVRIPQDAELPLIGCICFGLIDRGTNVIQTRCWCGCNLNCIFCSVDEGERSLHRVTKYEVDPEYMVEWLKELIKFKQVDDIEVHFDGCGEPTLHPRFADLVHMASQINGVKRCVVQTNGTLLDEDLVDELSECGLSRVNLSINSMDEDRAKELAGSSSYDLGRILEVCEYIRETDLQLMIAPVWIPGVNDEDIPRLIELAKRVCRGDVIIGIQKYEAHKYGRKPKGVKEMSWWRFYRMLGAMEKEFGVKLKLGPNDFGIHKARMLPAKFRRGEKIRVEILADGWMRGEKIGVAGGRCITVVNCSSQVGDTAKVKILENKHSIFMAREI